MFGRDCNPVYLFQNCKTTQGSDAEEEPPMNSEQSSSVFDPPNGSNEERWKELESNRMAERAAARSNILTEQKRQKNIYDTKVQNNR